MAATTISDLPRDVLVQILCDVFDAAHLDLPAGPPLRKIHKKLRRVSREWRDAADIAYIEYGANDVYLKLRAVPNRATVRARFPSLIHSLRVSCYRARGCKVSTTARALSSLCSSPDLRRVLKEVKLGGLCCADEAAAAVSAIAACPHLTSLQVCWWCRGHAGGDRPDMLAPLGELTGLQQLDLRTEAAWPTLPDSSSLTSLALERDDRANAFSPTGSDASLGRLRRLLMGDDLEETVDDQWASNDPLGLRADLDAGAWRPHLLTRVQELNISVRRCWRDGPEPRVYDGTVPAAAVWAPLAPTVTKLELHCNLAIFNPLDLATGAYAGLGVLTGLRSLDVNGQSVPCCPVDFDIMHYPHLTHLAVWNYNGLPINLARFPELVHVDAGAGDDACPIVLESVAALRRLELLSVSGRYPAVPRLNLARLFGGGCRLASLTKLSFGRVALEWDATAVADAPRASEFAAGAAALLPSLRVVEIKNNVEMKKKVRKRVVPAVLALVDE